MDTNAKILIVEDEEDIRELIHFHLFKNKYKVIEAANGHDALELAQKEKPELIILDIMIPHIDGLKVCEKLKEDPETAGIKIIFLSAKGSEEDVIRGLELGADDYVSKPFSPKILMARIKTVLRRAGAESEAPSNMLSAHGIVMDDTRRKVEIDDNEINLTETEYQILKYFMSSPGHVYTRSQIVNKIKGHNHAVTDRSVDTQLVSLRKKMGVKSELIETVWGVGYRFREIEA